MLPETSSFSSFFSHMKPSAQASYSHSAFTFPVPQVLLIQKSTICSNTSYHGCRAGFYPQYHSSHPSPPLLNPSAGQMDHLDSAGRCSCGCIQVSEKTNSLNAFVHSSRNPPKPRRMDLMGTELLPAALRRQLPRTVNQERDAVGT